MTSPGGAPAAPRWLDELSFRTEPPWLTMGVRPLDVGDWLIRDDLQERELDLRRQLLDSKRSEVFAALPGTDAACEEVFDRVRTAAAVVEVDDRGHPLERAARLVQEDLCVMIERDGGYHLDAAVLCFPSHWRLREKLGKPLAAVHEPVAFYTEELEAKVDRFVARLTADRPVWRRNWTIHDHDHLFAPQAPPPRAVTTSEVGVELVLRSERQTLRRLPRTGAVVFTIKTQQAPMSVFAERPDLARRMADAIEALPTAALARRSFAVYAIQIAAFLRSLGSGAHTPSR